jgi:coproporphyrinogen III oxidase
VSSPSPTFEAFLEQTRDLQDRLVDALAEREPEAAFHAHPWTRDEGGGGTSRQLGGGAVLEKAAVGHSHVHGDDNPLTGRAFHGGGVSLIVHPRNPHAPAAHLNLRRFEEPQAAWFGGVVDLNPMGFPYDEDTLAFHRALRAACREHDRPYEAWAKRCEAYYWIDHREVPRGVGGVFFDRHRTDDPEADLAFLDALGEAFLDVYPRLVDRRAGTPYDEDDRARQLERRAWYAEFNLVHDEGTRFGLESGGAPEAVLSSMPPKAAWPTP